MSEIKKAWSIRLPEVGLFDPPGVGTPQMCSQTPSKRVDAMENHKNGIIRALVTGTRFFESHKYA